MVKLKNPIFRATLDNAFISKDVFKYVYSGELARRFCQRKMKLLIGEVEHEEIIYGLGAPTDQAELLPRLLNYYRLSLSRALIDHYMKRNQDISEMYTRIITDVQVRAATRAFSQALVEGGVSKNDVFRYRISLPINGIDDTLDEEQRQMFAGKVPHSFDFLHWWYFLLYSHLRLGTSNELDSQRPTTRLSTNGLYRSQSL
jgi:carboxylesterase type B